MDGARADVCTGIDDELRILTADLFIFSIDEAAHGNSEIGRIGPEVNFCLGNFENADFFEVEEFIENAWKRPEARNLEIGPNSFEFLFELASHWLSGSPDVDNLSWSLYLAHGVGFEADVAEGFEVENVASIENEGGLEHFVVDRLVIEFGEFVPLSENSDSMGAVAGVFG